MSDFKICAQASGVGGLTALNALATPVSPDPQFYFEPYREYIRLGDGTYRGVGAPVARWRFPLLNLAQRNQMASFCTAGSAQVYIATPKNSGTFAIFLATMRLPDTEPPNKAGQIQGYEITFEQLVEQ